MGGMYNAAVVMHFGRQNTSLCADDDFTRQCYFTFGFTVAIYSYFGGL